MISIKDGMSSVGVVTLSALVEIMSYNIRDQKILNYQCSVVYDIEVMERTFNFFKLLTSRLETKHTMFMLMKGASSCDKMRVVNLSV